MPRRRPPNSRTDPDSLPELVLATRGDNASAQRLSRLRKQGKLRPLYAGIYSSNLRASDEDVVHRNWSRILAYLAPGSVVSHRSAFELAPHEGLITATRASGRRQFELPGLSIKALVKPARGPLTRTRRPGASDVPYEGIHIASQPRAFLENLTTDRRLAPRQLPRAEIEARLDRILALRGPAALNSLRDDAREAAKRLGMLAEFETLDSLVGALLGTRPARRLKTAAALARAGGKPYDAGRIALFERAAAQLRDFPFADIAEPARRGAARDMFAFVESYFSNYIEGTTFTVEEAGDIVFRGKLIAHRREDSQDVLGTFEAAQRDPFYSAAPDGEEAFLGWLQRANRRVLGARPDKSPGDWKEKPNQAGNTLFVLPELVPGTLARAWPLVAMPGHAMQRALLAMIVVSEVHPFADGNGRTARLLMNCFLTRDAQCRIIVPTIFREDYLLALKAVSHQQDTGALVRAMRLCQAWTAELDYTLDARAMERELAACHALEEDTRIHRLLSPRTRLPMSVPGNR